MNAKTFKTHEKHGQDDAYAIGLTKEEALKVMDSLSGQLSAREPGAHPIGFIHVDGRRYRFMMLIREEPVTP